MVNTPEGARKSAETKIKNNPNHFSEIGAKGGAKSKGKPRSEEVKRKISEGHKRRKALKI